LPHHVVEILLFRQPPHLLQVVRVLVHVFQLIDEHLFVDHSCVSPRETVDELTSFPFAVVCGFLVYLRDFLLIRLDSRLIPDKYDSVAECGVDDSRRKRLDITHVYEAVSELLEFRIDTIPKAESLPVVHLLGKPKCDVHVGFRTGSSPRVRAEKKREEDRRSFEILAYPVEIDAGVVRFRHICPFGGLD
jgi:hypothetical protein